MLAGFETAASRQRGESQVALKMRGDSANDGVDRVARHVQVRGRGQVEVEAPFHHVVVQLCHSVGRQSTQVLQCTASLGSDRAQWHDHRHVFDGPETRVLAKDRAVEQHRDAALHHGVEYAFRVSVSPRAEGEARLRVRLRGHRCQVHHGVAAVVHAVGASRLDAVLLHAHVEPAVVPGVVVAYEDAVSPVQRGPSALLEETRPQWPPANVRLVCVQVVHGANKGGELGPLVQGRDGGLRR